MENDPKFARAAKYFANACKHSRAYDAALESALVQYGNHGPNVSGCGRNHFPSDVKDALRMKARQVSFWSKMGHGKARPARVHASTMVKLARLVATRDGFGFYGPQGEMK